jgi:hypothetical protein
VTRLREPSVQYVAEDGVPIRDLDWMLCPPYEGTAGGLGILGTPCRKKRDVPLAKGDKATFLAPEMYKLRAKDFALDIPVGCVALFQRTRSFAVDGASKGATHPTERHVPGRGFGG